MATTAELTIDWITDEYVEIHANGRHIAGLNRDDHGRDGMRAGIQVATHLAEVFGAKVTTTGTPSL